MHRDRKAATKAAPSGLQDNLCRYLDAAETGQAGSNATAILSKNDVTIEVL